MNLLLLFVEFVVLLLRHEFDSMKIDDESSYQTDVERLIERREIIRLEYKHCQIVK